MKKWVNKVRGSLNKFPEIFRMGTFIDIVLLKCQIAFLKLTSCDNQALLGCIPIAAVVVHLNLKS